MSLIKDKLPGRSRVHDVKPRTNDGRRTDQPRDDSAPQATTSTTTGQGRPSPETSNDGAGAKDSLRRGKKPRKAADPGTTDGSSNDLRWHAHRRLATGSKLGLYDPAPPGAPSSTRQMEASLLAVAAPPTNHKGLIFGLDTGTGWIISHDPFFAYGHTVQNPNVCYIGDVGSGKSSAMKTWGLLRPLVLGRDIVVLDKKRQKGTGEGEYAPLCRHLGREPIAFRIGGGGSCINILDPRIGAGDHDEGHAGAPAGQSMLLRAVTEEALARPLTPFEGKALRTAHRRALRNAAEHGYVATISHVMDALLHPDEEDAREVEVPRAELRGWGLEIAFELERLISDDLAGLIDGETSPEVQLGEGLTVFDVSNLPEAGPALAIVMTLVNTWLANMLHRRTQNRPTHLLVEEAWHLVRGTVAEVIARNLKLSRALGLSSHFAFHHISDVPEGSTAQAIIKECDTIFIYQQKKPADARAVLEMYDLPASSYLDILKLATGSCLLKIGSEVPIRARHLRSPSEVTLTDTDGAMRQVQHARD
ncbi:ATP/GTP-binding protein [Paeniglutamicibacter sp. NPDC012692]|uniref:ATP/GTP-binding protein n=1 Tax=Paeniglutamicibacter sp. NPDC012692 TaxID=3364388 RepID=UPI003695AF82